MGCCCCFSVGKSCPTLWPHGLQHASLPCPSLSPGVCSNSCPLSQWCYLIISSSAALFSFCLQFFLASASFPMSQLFTSGGQSFRGPTLASVLPMNGQGWFPLEVSRLCFTWTFHDVPGPQHNASQKMFWDCSLLPWDPAERPEERSCLAFSLTPWSLHPGFRAVREAAYSTTVLSLKAGKSEYTLFSSCCCC